MQIRTRNNDNYNIFSPHREKAKSILKINLHRLFSCDPQYKEDFISRNYGTVKKGAKQVFKESNQIWKI